MNSITFTVPGKPQGKGRPRFNSKTKTAYTPRRTQEYETYIQRCYIQQYGNQMIAAHGPVEMLVDAIFEPPKVSKTQTEDMLSGKIHPVKKPDMDNILKMIMDALNGLAYTDDRQVTFVTGLKTYGSMPEVRITLRGRDA